LPSLIETEKRAGEMSPGSSDCSATGAVEPIRRGVKVALFVQSNEDLFDQESVIENDVRDGGHLLIGEVQVFDFPEAILVSLSEYSAEFTPCDLDSTRNDESGIAEIDDPYFATVFDTPTMA
jgi:hypothetical protein